MQNLIVAAIVLSACWHVLRRYLPQPLKRRLATAVAARCRARGWHEMAARLQPTTQMSATGCDSCSACAGAGKEKNKTGNQAVQKISVDSLKRSLRR